MTTTPPRRRGRETRLTPARRQRLIDSVAAGNTIRAAAETADLGSRTVDRYQQRGRDAQQALDEHLAQLTPARRAVLDRWNDDKLTAYHERHVPDTELVYWRLWRDLTRARAQAEERAVARIREAGNGYEASETVVESRQVLGKDGEVVTLTTTRTVTRHVRDWRAEMAWLERANRQDWGRQPAEVVVSAPAGSAADDGSAPAIRARAAAILDEVAAQREKREAGAGGEAPAGSNGQAQ